MSKIVDILKNNWCVLQMVKFPKNWKVLKQRVRASGSGQASVVVKKGGPHTVLCTTILKAPESMEQTYPITDFPKTPTVWE